MHAPLHALTEFCNYQLLKIVVQRLHLACMGEHALHLKVEVYQVTVYIRTTVLSYSP